MYSLFQLCIAQILICLFEIQSNSETGKDRVGSLLRQPQRLGIDQATAQASTWDILKCFSQIINSEIIGSGKAWTLTRTST